MDFNKLDRKTTYIYVVAAVVVLILLVVLFTCTFSSFVGAPPGSIAVKLDEKSYLLDLNEALTKVVYLRSDFIKYYILLPCKAGDRNLYALMRAAYSDLREFVDLPVLRSETERSLKMMDLESIYKDAYEDNNELAEHVYDICILLEEVIGQLNHPGYVPDRMLNLEKTYKCLDLMSEMTKIEFTSLNSMKVIKKERDPAYGGQIDESSNIGMRACPSLRYGTVEKPEEREQICNEEFNFPRATYKPDNNNITAPLRGGYNYFKGDSAEETPRMLKYENQYHSKFDLKTFAGMKDKIHLSKGLIVDHNAKKGILNDYDYLDE